jgi:hypothetical protein
MEPMLLSLFQAHIRDECRSVLHAAADFDTALASGDYDRVWIDLHNLVTAAGNVSKALWGSGRPEQKAKQSAVRHPVRQSLGLSDQETYKLQEVAFRNHLEHYDEKLLKWWETSDTHIHVSRVIGRNAVGGNAIQPRDIFQQYLPDSGEVIFWGETFDVGRLVRECSEILKVAERETAKPFWE